MQDTIDRQAVLEALNCYPLPDTEKSEYAQGMAAGVTFATALVKCWPAVRSSRMTGHWEEKHVSEKGEHTIEEWQEAKCSKCGLWHITPYLYYFSEYNYCPSCGAKMEKGGD